MMGMRTAKILKCDNPECGKEQEFSLDCGWTILDHLSFITFTGDVDSMVESRVDSLKDIPGREAEVCSLECLHKAIDYFLHATAKTSKELHEWLKLSPKKLKGQPDAAQQ